MCLGGARASCRCLSLGLQSKPQAEDLCARDFLGSDSSMWEVWEASRAGGHCGFLGAQPREAGPCLRLSAEDTSEKIGVPIQLPPSQALGCSLRPLPPALCPAARAHSWGQRNPLSGEAGAGGRPQAACRTLPARSAPARRGRGSASCRLLLQTRAGPRPGTEARPCTPSPVRASRSWPRGSPGRASASLLQ